MKKYLRIALLLMLQVAVLNCQKTEEEDPVAGAEKCEVSTDKVEAEGSVSTVSFDIVTSKETMWRLELDSYHPWLEVSPMEGTGSTTVNCLFAENPKQVEREAVVTLTAYMYGEPYYTVDIPVVQHTLAPYIEIDSTLAEQGYTIPGKGEKGLSFSISSNVDWTVETPEWIHADPVSGNGKATVTFDVDANTLEADGRNADITISSVDGKLSQSIPVSQAYYESQSVDGVTITIYGMYGWCPEGEGIITLTDIISSDTKEVPVTVVISEKTTIITLGTTIDTGLYNLEKYTTGENVSQLGVRFELLPDNLQVEILSWDANFKTFGGGSAEDPIVIKDEATLRKLATVINKGESYSGKHFQLAADIDVSSEEWIPIGTGNLSAPKPFSGIFDGGGHTITGMKITTNGGFKGLFGIVAGADANNKAEVKNIILKGKEDGSYDITVNDVNAPQSGVGSIAGAVINYALISGCSNYLYMKLSANSGGIIGCVDNNGQGAVTYPKRPNGTAADVIVEDCHNYGNIDCYPLNLKRWNIAGVVASNMGTVVRCSNSGNIKSLPSAIGPFWNIGGIVSVNSGDVFECYNTGTIESTGNNCAGIVAFASGVCPSVIKDCYNTGFINVDNVASGGILGNSGATSTTMATVENSYSIGDKSEKGGGLFGTLQTQASLVFRHCASVHEQMVGSGSNGFASDPQQLKVDDRYKYFNLDEMKKQVTFTTKVWDSVAPGWDFENVWAIDEGSSTPYLKHNTQSPHPGTSVK